MASNALPRGSACLSCRRKKQRCDAGKPACGSCVKGSKVCEYEKPRRPLYSEEFITHVDDIQRTITGSSTSPGTISDSSTPSPPRPSQYYQSQDVPSQIISAPMFWPSVQEQTARTPQDVPRNIRESLIRTFLLNKHKCCFEINTERFLESLGRPAEDLSRPHPALIEAILLLGCYFSRSPDLVEYEVSFLSGAREQLAISYDDTDRLNDFIRASNLVALYYFFKGWYLEAYQQITNSIYVTLTCALHQIHTPVWRPAIPGEERYYLTHPRDGVEHGERIITFWQTFCFDKLMALGGPPRLADSPTLRIVTPWPRLLREYEQGNVRDDEIATVSHLYDSRIVPARLYTLDGLHAQGLALISQATTLAGLPSNHESVLLVDATIQTFASRLPSIFNGGDCGEILGQHGYSAVNPRLAYINTLPHAASLFMYQHGADSNARARTVNAIQGMAAIVNQLGDADYEHLFIGLGRLWVSVCEILLRILSRAHDSNAEPIKRDYYTLAGGLRRLSIIYPALGLGSERAM